MKKRSRCTLAAALWVAASIGISAGSQADYANDFRIWNEFMWTQHKGERWLAFGYGELRWVDDASHVGAWVLQQKVYHQANSWLQLGTGPGWIEIEQPDKSWNTLARLELEANCIHRLSSGEVFALYNRLETRWWENRDWETEYVTRHRLFYLRSANWLPRMLRYEFSNELFYDFSENRINENRFRPANFFFRLSENSTFNVFTQLRSLRSKRDGHWSHAYIVGTGLRW